MQPVVAALKALSRADREAAQILLVTEPEPSLLAGQLRTYLGSDGHAEVYDAPAAFERFIRGGGNVGLYDAVSSALTGLYRDHDVRSLADLGCGDGRALIPAVAAAPSVARVDMVEPSVTLLDTCVRAAALELGPDFELLARHTTTQKFAADAAAGGGRWDLVQSTFSLHTLPPAERTVALTRLRAHTDRLAIVEFDVPDFPPGSDARFEFLARTYEIGLAEYEDDGPLVAQGFLMPVLVGQLAPDATRHTYEQTRASWVEQVEAVGYSEVTTTALFPYWSAPAFLLTARSRR